MPDPRFKRLYVGPATFLGTIDEAGHQPLDVWQRHEEPKLVECIYFDGDTLAYSMDQLGSAKTVDWVRWVLKLIAKSRDPSISPNA